MIIDSYNRVHDYLRISLTDNCDLRCVYCMPEEDYGFTPSAKLMQADEIEAIARIFVQEGVTKIRLTGGEPLVRKDFADILKRLSAFPVSITMTTNGVRLHEFVDEIRQAGVRSINISLDTLQRERFIMMTRRDKQPDVVRNIRFMVQQGLQVKVNAVIIKGINDDEVNDFVELTRELPVHVRFIEFMPFDKNKWNSERVVTQQAMLERIQSVYEVLPLDRMPNETAQKFKVPGFQGIFAFISTMSAPFCGDCNRMRLTADGKMKNCLFSVSETDLLTAFRNGEDIVPLIHGCIRDKKPALGGQFTADLQGIDAASLHNRTMISIGG